MIISLIYLSFQVYEANQGGDIRGLVPWQKHEHKKTQQAINL